MKHRGYACSQIESPRTKYDCIQPQIKNVDCAGFTVYGLGPFDDRELVVPLRGTGPKDKGHNVSS